MNYYRANDMNKYTRIAYFISRIQSAVNCSLGLNFSFVASKSFANVTETSILVSRVTSVHSKYNIEYKYSQSPRIGSRSQLLVAVKPSRLVRVLGNNGDALLETTCNNARTPAVSIDTTMNRSYFINGHEFEID